MRANRWVVVAAALIALAALFIDGYSYIWRAVNHIPMTRTLAADQFPNFAGKDIYLHKGLDLQGGTEIVLEIDPRSLPTGVDLAIAQNSTVEVMDKRVNGIGVSEASVAPQGDRRVVVQLPGVDIDRATQLIGRTAKLTFRTWVAATPGADGRLKIPSDSTGQPVVDPLQVPAPEGGKCVASTAKVECIPLGYLPKFTGVDGSMVTSASNTTDSSSNAPIVEFTLNDQGTTILGQVTANMPSQPAPLNQLAIFLDNQMINNATVQSPLNNGQVQITGGNIASDATYRQDLASTLTAGRLPGKMSIVESNSVGATLGFDSVRRSLLAGALGLAVVVMFMIAYYRLPGLVASLALAFYAAVTLALFKLVPVTITLAGIAGLRALGGHGGRRQRADLRAIARGAAHRPVPGGGGRGGRAARLPGHPGLQHLHPDHLPGAVPARQHPVPDRLHRGQGLRPDAGHRRHGQLLLGGVRDPDDPGRGDPHPQHPDPGDVRRRAGPVSMKDILGKRNYFFLLSLVIIIPGIISMATPGVPPRASPSPAATASRSTTRPASPWPRSRPRWTGSAPSPWCRARAPTGPS